MSKLLTYREKIEISQKYKQAYVNGIEKIIEEREKAAYELRHDYCKDIFRNPEKYRQDFRAMLGWPLTEKQGRCATNAKTEKLSEKKECSIYRVTVDVIEGFAITGLLFEKGNERRPLVIAQHGGAGTPEVVGNFYNDTANYNDMIERMLKYNVNVFAPQLLLWIPEDYSIVFDRVNLDARLKRVGSSITALEIYAITKIIDYFEQQEYVSNFGMIGLSYGGFYTLFTAAIDTRIKSCVSCSFFNTRSTYAWSDWTWFRSAEMFSDAEVACLVYPRRLCLEVGTKEKLFTIDGARKEVQRLREKMDEIEQDWLDVIEFEGTHEFCKDDLALERLAKDIQ